MHRASRSLVLLLGLTLVLAALLAYEAQRATRSHRVTAERALRDYATVAALELATASAESLETRVAAALDPVVGSPAASPYDPLTPAAAIAAMAADLLPCPGKDSARSWFAYDFSSGSLSLAGAPDRRRWPGSGARWFPAAGERLSPGAAARRRAEWPCTASSSCATAATRCTMRRSPPTVW